MSNSNTSEMLIKGGTIVNDDEIWKADILIKDEKIWAIGENLKCEPNTRVIDASGKYVFPGGIDTHTHSEFAFMGTRTIDDFESATRGALAGGTTTIMDFVVDPSVRLLTIYEEFRERAKKSCCDYAFHFCVPRWSEEIERDMTILVKEKGVSSFKMFMVYTGLQISDTDMLKLFKHIRSLGALALIHAENGDAIAMNQKRLLKLGATGPECHLQSRPEELEAEATNRVIILANQVLCPVYIVHVMSKTAADVIAKRRLEGYSVFGEVVASALAVDGSNVFHKCWKHAAAHVMSPPLRADPTTPGHLMDMLANGGLQTTGSDNCTFNSDQKALGKGDFTKIPNGVNGVEDRMSVIWEKGVVSGKLDLCQFVAITSTNAAKIFNVYPKKGRIAIGSDADIVVWDPNLERTISAKTHHQKCDFNVFEGMKIHGVPAYVFCRGKLFVEGNKVNAQSGYGRFLPIPPYSRPAYGRIEQKPCHTIDIVKREDTRFVKPSKEVELFEGLHIRTENEDGPQATGNLKTPTSLKILCPPAKSSVVL